MAAQDSAYGVTTTQFVIGATLVVGITAGPNVNSQMLLQISGGTLWITGSSQLIAVSSGATGSRGGYPLSSIPITIGGQARLFISESAGVTSVVALIKTLNSPSEFT